MPLMQIARSLVITPLSIVSTQASSRSVANLASGVLLSSLARWLRPRVQAKMEAVGRNQSGSYSFSPWKSYIIGSFKQKSVEHCREAGNNCVCLSSSSCCVCVCRQYFLPPPHMPLSRSCQILRVINPSIIRTTAVVSGLL